MEAGSPVLVCPAPCHFLSHWSPKMLNANSLRIPNLWSLRWYIICTTETGETGHLICVIFICLLFHTLTFRSSSPWAPLIAQLVKNLPANARDPGLIPGSGRSPGEGKSYPCQYSGLGCEDLDTTEWLWLFTFTVLERTQLLVVTFIESRGEGEIGRILPRNLASLEGWHILWPKT